MDRVIQIATMVKCQGSSSEPFIRVIFTLKSCAPIVGNQVIAFDEEKDLLQVNIIESNRNGFAYSESIGDVDIYN